jgi:hypothetical protein
MPLSKQTHKQRNDDNNNNNNNNNNNKLFVTAERIQSDVAECTRSLSLTSWSSCLKILVVNFLTRIF